MNLWKYASPVRFHVLAGQLAPWFAVAAGIAAVAGLYLSLVLLPADYRQGDAYRILFIHVPAAWLSMFIYLIMAIYAALGWVLNTRLSSMMAAALAPTGALFTLITLISGALWGRPTWGTYWVWDARLTSELLLLFLYLGFMALHGAIDDARRAAKSAGILAVAGLVNLPVIYFSVYWWNTLHQGATLSLGSPAKMSGDMLLALLLMSFALWCYSVAVTLVRVRRIISSQENRAPMPRITQLEHA